MNATTTMPLPVIPDLPTGMRLISGLPLATPRHAQDELDRILDSLAQTPPTADVYLELLEQSRMPLCFVEEELAHRYASKALPLGESEEHNFRLVTGTWRKFAHAYFQCTRLESSARGTGDRSRLAIGLQRSIYYSGLVIVDRPSAGRRTFSAGPRTG